MTLSVQERTIADDWRAKSRCLKDKRERISSQNSGDTQTVVLYSQDLRSQLSQERDSVRHVSLQKEIEVKDLQTRLEKSVHMNSSTHPYVTNPVLG